MAKLQRKPKPLAMRVDMPKFDYQPTAEEKRREVDMLCASLKSIRDAFFRPIKSKA